ncbi:hypothetical protein BDF22DRAFT_779009 [Syncephalis plumigaleata]|nr:hypothetical protein BDF22DRAFT_779009 [Syncephalis plumigaleata]
MKIHPLSVNINMKLFAIAAIVVVASLATVSAVPMLVRRTPQDGHLGNMGGGLGNMGGTNGSGIGGGGR